DRDRVTVGLRAAGAGVPVVVRDDGGGDEAGGRGRGEDECGEGGVDCGEGAGDRDAVGARAGGEPGPGECPRPDRYAHRHRDVSRVQVGVGDRDPRQRGGGQGDEAERRGDRVDRRVVDRDDVQRPADGGAGECGRVGHGEGDGPYAAGRVL